MPAAFKVAQPFDARSHLSAFVATLVFAATLPFIDAYLLRPSGADVYRSVPQAEKVQESALRQMVKSFFDGSAASAATALLGLSRNLKPDELDALQAAIDEARERRS